ncbi:uncharacterized protein LOC110460420 [Mizuhopecten yessoensis]|uniref:uncharacterized protein LOC110460420 n=1 Tax=Mizuhopecten yessoensis TaxID=6573 RepID=UPI000B458D0D|nr:uncharacterized protein LOC110460420 [Mizuhopecten yessoensis]
MRVCNIWLLEVLCILSTIMIVNTSVNTSRKPTVKITTQSSIFDAALLSGKVVDGCTQQNFSQKCCSHTQIGQQEAWWQVDLEGPIVMEYVKIYYRGCPFGRYGDGNCDSECDAGCGNDLCDPVTGKCACNYI